MPTTSDVPALDVFLNYLDKVADLAQLREQPAYSETCLCGGSVVVGRETSRADLRRIHANFLGRHRACAGLDAKEPPNDHA